MVLGHSSLPKPISNFIWSFHMPLFFIASGWMANWEKYSMKEFTIRKCHSLMIPFLCYSIILLKWRELVVGGNFVSWIKNGWDGYALWFIPVLFIASNVVKSIFIIARKYIRYVIVAGFIVLGYALCYKGVILPWTLSTLPYAVFLIFTGSILRSFQQEVETPKWWVLLILFVITIVISQHWRLDLCCNQILPFIPLTVAAITGTMMIFVLSSYITENMKIASRILQAVGKETYIVVAFSQIIIITINQHITHSVPVKYTMLIVILVMIKYVKDMVTKYMKSV